ncbi:MAG TPA: histidine kinase [Actinospica sp.]|nr:histidine kinase [Actinospica sp.]
MTFPLTLPGRTRRLLAHANRGATALLVDLLITAIAEASVIWGVLSSQQNQGTSWSWWVWVWAIALPLALIRRRAAPFAVFWIVGSGTVLLSLLATLAITWNHSCEFMLLVAMATVAYYRDGWRFWLAAISSVAASFVVVDQGLGKNTVSALIIAMAFVAGRLAAQQRDLARLMTERAREAEKTAQARGAQAAAEERTRIARDMHDILAHAVSLMIVQAEAGAAVVHRDAARAEAAFDAVADGGREALTQLRRMLGVLREGDALALSPQPTIGELPRLVETVRATRIDVRMVVQGTPRRLPQDTEVAVYRTAQEALTNMVKHSRAERAELRLDWTPEALTVRVTDDGVGPRGGVPESGRGLIGIRERITSCGGTVSSGGGPDGRGFQLLARIPTA